MKIFSFFYSEKVIFHKKKKNSIIAQQEEDIAIYTTRNDNGRVRNGSFSSRPGSFIFFNSQTCLILKIKQGEANRENSQTPAVYILFLFLFFNFNFLYLLFYFYFIKINIFHKNKNIMNFYKLFIKHYNNNYYLY